MKCFECNRGAVAFALLAAVLFCGAPAGSAAGLTPHGEAINQAIEDGLAWLGANQRPDGSWEASGDNYVGGAGLGAMAFMAQGYDESSLYNGSPVVADAIALILSQQKPAGWMGLEYVEGSIFWGGDPPDVERNHHSNYETSVAVMALAMTDNPDYDDEIAAAAAWLDDCQYDELDPNRVEEPEALRLGSFGYSCTGHGDLSNTQFSLVALAAAGALTTNIADDAITYIRNCQNIQHDPATQISLFNDEWGSCANTVRWDPTGTRIVYNARVDEAEWPCSLYVQKLAVVDEVVADMGASLIGSARYSPAADKIAFTASEPLADHNDIYVVNPDGTGLTQLTGMPEEYWGGWTLAWSPDGAKLAVTLCLSETEWDADIHIYDLTTNTLGPGLGVGPCAQWLDWSPATTGLYADKLLYTSCTGSDVPCLYMVDVTTGMTANLTAGLGLDCASAGPWSPDATKIVFAAWGAGPDEEQGICLLDPDGTDFEMLTHRGEWGPYDGNPLWRPDGSQILFRRRECLIVMNSDGTGLCAVPSGKIMRGIGDWHQDSLGTDWLLCLAGDDAEGEVHSLELALPVHLAPCGFEPKWSPTGDRINFEAPHNVFDPLDPNDNWCVWVADADGVAPALNVSGDGPAAQATWSPDGSRIAIQGTYDLFGLPGDWPPGWDPWCSMSSIWVVDPDGVAPPHNLCAPHHGIGCADQPDWGALPDGMGGTTEKIVYHAFPTEGTHGWSDRDDIWTASPDGSGHVNLTAGVPGSLHNSIPLWSPDSTKLAYRMEDELIPGTYLLSVMNHDGGSKLELATADWYGYGDWSRPAWSPDSSTLAFLVGERPHLVNADGLLPDPQPVPRVGGVVQLSDWPAVTPWAGDGSLITAAACFLDNADPVLFKADGYPGSGYAYTPGWGPPSYGSMTAAAVWCLRLCGEPVGDPWVQNGLDWLANNYAYDENPDGEGAWHYYYLWSAAKALLGYNIDSLPGAAHVPVNPEDEVAFDPGWYYDFSKYLVGQQGADGSWRSDTDTFFALLVLQKELGVELYSVTWVPPLHEGTSAEAPDGPFKRGRTLPVKFRLYGAQGELVPDEEAEALTARLEVFYDQPCSEGTPVDPGDSPSDPGDEFRYVAEDDLFIFNLSTKDAAWLAGYTYGLEILINDVKAGEVFFSLR